MIQDKTIIAVAVAVAVLASRLSVVFFPGREVKIFNVVIHHFWYGIIFLVLAYLLPKEIRLLKLAAFGVGLGFVLDELVFMILGGGDDIAYWAPLSLIGTVILLGILELVIWLM